MKEHLEAIEGLKKAVKINPENPDIWCSWGVALVELKQFEEAAEKFETAIKLQSDFVSAWYGWGFALMAMGKKKEAVEKIKKGSKFAPNITGDISGPECKVL
jgi:tetratricopeptide (TPR) repeat protein